MSCAVMHRTHINRRKHPSALRWLFSVETWERFAYYGMRAILVLYLMQSLFLFIEDEAERARLAGLTFGLFGGCVYLMTIFGGYIADRLHRRRACVTFGGLLMASGYFLMMVPVLPVFFVALLIVALGNGLFKPNISAMLGDFYEEKDPMKDAAFTIFYMGINLGAFLSPFICGPLGEEVGWHWGFFAAGVGMLLGSAIYRYAFRHMGTVGLPPETSIQTQNNSTKVELPKIPLTQREKRRVWAICLITFFAIFFWMAFEQAATSLVLFAEKYTNRDFFGYTIGASVFAAANPFFVITLSLPLARLWTKLGERKKNPSIPTKIAIGLAAIPVGFALMILASYLYMSTGSPVSMLWLISLYFILTVGELCLSPIALSMVSNYAPEQYRSLMMGVWFVSNFVAHVVGGAFGGYIETLSLTTFFGVLTGMGMFATIGIIACLPLLKRWLDE